MSVAVRVSTSTVPNMRMVVVLAFVLVAACGSSAGNSDDGGLKGSGSDQGSGSGDQGSGSGSGSDQGSGSNSVADLRFGIVGDTRPPNPGDTSGYPTAIITKIYQDLEAEHLRRFGVRDRRPVTTMYAEHEPRKRANAADSTKYMSARAETTRVTFSIRRWGITSAPARPRRTAAKATPTG